MRIPESRFAELRAKMEALRNPSVTLRIPTGPTLILPHIKQDIARLSFYRGERPHMARSVANKHGISVQHVYRLLSAYEQTHTLEFPATSLPSSHWKNIAAYVETGVVGNGNRRVVAISPI